MGIKRTICCDICSIVREEPVQEQGWKGWGAVQGVVLDGIVNPTLCPECLAATMAFIEERKHGMD